MKIKTYQEDRSCIKNREGEIAPLDALYPTIRVSSDDENKKQTHYRMPAIHESTHQEDMQKEIDQENGSRAENVMTRALHHKSSPDYDTGNKLKTSNRRRSR